MQPTMVCIFYNKKPFRWDIFLLEVKVPLRVPEQMHSIEAKATSLQPGKWNYQIEGSAVGASMLQGS